MPRSPVQFQKGQSLAEFTDRYGSAMPGSPLPARWPQGFECRMRAQTLLPAALPQCLPMHPLPEVSLTASTVFANTKLKYLLTQSKNGLSAMALGRQLGVSYNTAWSLKHKLMQVMKERDESGRLGHIVQVDDAYLGGETRGGKRGRGAEGKTPFVAAVQVTEEGRPVALRMSCVKGFRKQEIDRHLRRETVVYSDGLACFRGVEEAGCEHRPRVTGGGPVSLPGSTRSCRCARSLNV